MSAPPPRATRPRRRAPEDTRRRILDAARRLFIERGYSQTSTGRIAKLAGVAEGSVFHHFGSKTKLLSAVARDYGEGINHAMFLGMKLDQKPDVEAMMRRLFMYVKENGKLHELVMCTADPSEWNRAMMAERQDVIDALSRYFTRWSELGYIRTRRPKMAASLLYGLVNSALFECFESEPDDALIDEYIDECSQIIMRSVNSEQ